MNRNPPPITNALDIGPSLVGDELQLTCHGDRACPTKKGRPPRVPSDVDLSASEPAQRRSPRGFDDAEPARVRLGIIRTCPAPRHAVCELQTSMNRGIGWSSPRRGSLRSCAMNAARIRLVTLLAAAILATRALGQTPDHVAACYSPSTTVRLGNIEDIILNQNSPNPFAEQTTITYKLPDTVKTAKMLFYDAQGGLIKAVNLTSHRGPSNDRGDEMAECAGEGQVFIFADDLRAGLYTYALVVDERKVSSKQMVKSR